MALDYRKCAEEIFSHLGGRDNIISAAHCATRLRMVIADNSKVDAKALEDVEGVKGMFNSNGQLQLIIGTGTVNKVYDEFLAVSGMSAATKADVKAAAAARQPLPKRLIKTLGDVFVPILPAIVASGLMMGLVEALGKAFPSFNGSDWYQFLDLVSGAAFAYLPVIIAISAARVFGGNIFLGGVIGLCMIHSGLINAWTVAGMDPGDIPVWHLLFFNVKAVGYQGHVIPVIIAVWIMCKLENWLHKHVPEMLDLFITPLVTVLVTAFLTFTIIGPIFSTAETYVLEGAKTLITVGHGAGAAVMGAVYPITVVMGLHHMYNVIEAGRAAGGKRRAEHMDANCFCSQFCPVRSLPCCGCKSPQQEDKGRGPAIGAVRFPGHYGTSYFRSQSPLHETIHLRHDRRRLRSPLRVHITHWRQGLWSYGNPGASDY